MPRENTKKIEEPKRGEIVIYKGPGGPEIEVRLSEKTVWLDAHLMACLFGVNRPAIVKHINNIYKTGELNKKSTCSILEQVAADGKIRKMHLYNLDMIISVGYRVNSKQATQFRIWATKTLKQYLIQGYAINKKQLLKARENFEKLQETVFFLQKKAGKEKLQGQEKEILNLLSDYAKTLSILEQYDRKKIKEKRGKKTKFVLNYANCRKIVDRMKQSLSERGEASELFGRESSCFEGIIKGLYQKFGGKELYPSIEDKASHLLYFTIKDHPFTDGNKRIASFLFVYFLDKTGYLHKENGEKKINDNALTTLALLIATSDRKEKEIMIQLIKALLAEK